jgi:hypothetical protein
MAIAQGDLLASTGQVWKLKLLPFSIFAGTVVIWIGLWFQNVLPRSHLLAILFAGFTLDVAGLLIPALWIACPRCHAHWLWSLYRKEQVQNWNRIMRSLARCPRCGFYG